MKETIDLLGKTLTNILTALYGVVGRFGALCGDEGKKASVNYHNSRELKWFVDPEGVHIYFDVYEAASYSEGFIDILLSDRVYKKQGEGKSLLKLEKRKELKYAIR